MTPGALVSRCEACGWKGLPARLWCPVCAGDRVRPARVHGGIVGDVTVVRRSSGGRGNPVRLGEIKLAGGGTVIARLEPGASAGAQVQLFDDGGATVARPR